MHHVIECSAWCGLYRFRGGWEPRELLVSHNSISSGSFECLEHVQAPQYSLFTLSISWQWLFHFFVCVSSYLLGYGSIGITFFNLTNLESQMNRCPKLCSPCEVLKAKDGLERLSVAGMCHWCVCISLWCGLYASSLQSWLWWFLGHLWGKELGLEG